MSNKNFPIGNFYQKFLYLCNNVVMEEFIKRLKKLRAEKGLTQVQLSKATGISTTALSYWENGIRIPNALAIITLAKFFDVTTDYLLGVSDI